MLKVTVGFVVIVVQMRSFMLEFASISWFIVNCFSNAAEKHIAKFITKYIEKGPLSNAQPLVLHNRCIIELRTVRAVSGVRLVLVVTSALSWIGRRSLLRKAVMAMPAVPPPHPATSRNLRRGTLSFPWPTPAAVVGPCAHANAPTPLWTAGDRGRREPVPYTDIASRWGEWACKYSDRMWWVRWCWIRGFAFTISIDLVSRPPTMVCCCWQPARAICASTKRAMTASDTVAMRRRAFPLGSRTVALSIMRAQ